MEAQSHNENPAHAGPQLYSAKVAYNGAVFEEAFPPSQTVEAVFRKAVAHFDLQSSAANLGLFFGQTELAMNATLMSLGVPSGSTLVLRPRVVRNG